MGNTKFCENCGQKLTEGIPFIQKANYFEFEDGYYCEGCAKVKVKSARGGRSNGRKDNKKEYSMRDLW